MKATIVLVGNAATQNYGSKMMLSAHRIGCTGFEMTRLPFHVSLKQPFHIPNIEEFEEFFDRFAATVSPLTIPMEEIILSPNSAIGGLPSGCLALRARRTDELDGLQKRLFRELTERFGPCPAEHDDDYIFHMTLAIGKAPYEDYLRAYEALKNQPLPGPLGFDRLAFLYYDDDAIAPGSYFCYKLWDLERT